MASLESFFEHYTVLSCVLAIIIATVLIEIGLRAFSSKKSAAPVTAPAPTAAVPTAKSVADATTGTLHVTSATTHESIDHAVDSGNAVVDAKVAKANADKTAAYAKADAVAAMSKAEADRAATSALADADAMRKNNESARKAAHAMLDNVAKKPA